MKSADAALPPTEAAERAPPRKWLRVHANEHAAIRGVPR